MVSEFLPRRLTFCLYIYTISISHLDLVISFFVLILKLKVRKNHSNIYFTAVYGYRNRKRWILTQKEDLNSRHLNSHLPLFLYFTNVTIWFLEWDPELHLEETFKIICSNPFILQKEHRTSERGSLQLVSGWVGSRTQASWLWAQSCYFLFFPTTRNQRGIRQAIQEA